MKSRYFEAFNNILLHRTLRVIHIIKVSKINTFYLTLCGCYINVVKMNNR